MRKSQYQFDAASGGAGGDFNAAATGAAAGGSIHIPTGYEYGGADDDFGKLHCHFGFFHLFLGLGDAVVASTMLLLLCVSAFLFLQRRLIKQSAANRRRNMRKLLRGNELAYYFEKLGISKSS